MSKKLSIAIQIILFVAALWGSIYVAFTPPNTVVSWYSVDDSFYYYKVAQNLLMGHGWTFDGINLSNGFHPLWMLVCICVFWLAKFNLILPLRVLILVSGLFNAASAVVLFRLLNKHIHPAAATLGTVLWALLPSIYKTVTAHGMESSVSAFFLILLAYQASNVLTSTGKITVKQMAFVGLIGALTILARLDNVFIVAVVGLSLLFRIRKAPMDLITDIILLTIAVMLSWILRLGLDAVALNSYSIYPMLSLAIVIKPIVYYFCGMYQGFGELKPAQKLLRQIVAAGVNLLLMFGILTLLHQLGILKFLSKSVIVLDAFISSALIFCLRLRRWKPSSKDLSPFAGFRKWIKEEWRTYLQNGMGYAFPIAIIIGSYMIFNRIVFGTFSPVSGQIKVWWNTMSNTVYGQKSSMLTLLGLNYAGSDSPWLLITSKVAGVANSLISITGKESTLFFSVVYLVLILVFLFLIFAILNSEGKRAGRKLFDLMIIPLFLGCVIQIAYYNTVGYQAIRSWYWVSQMLTSVMLIALLLDPIFSWLDRFSRKQVWSTIVAVLLIASVCEKHETYIVRNFPYNVPEKRQNIYLREVKELESFTDPGSYIGMTGGGYIAYFIQDRTVVNLDGLINSTGYFNAMKNGTAQAFLDAIPLDYVYGNSYTLLESDPYRSFLPGRLVEVGRISSSIGFDLFRYVINQ